MGKYFINISDNNNTQDVISPPQVLEWEKNIPAKNCQKSLRFHITPISTFKKMKTNLSDSDKGSKGADLL